MPPRVRRAKRVVVLAASLAGLALLPAALVTACVDGVTPDCSDPKNKCGPDVDGSADGGDATAPTAPETGTDTSMPDASTADSPDPDPDAGDEI